MDLNQRFKVRPDIVQNLCLRGGCRVFGASRDGMSRFVVSARDLFPCQEADDFDSETGRTRLYSASTDSETGYVEFSEHEYASIMLSREVSH